MGHDSPPEKINFNKINRNTSNPIIWMEGVLSKAIFNKAILQNPNINLHVIFH
jgi:hypothetical protein